MPYWVVYLVKAYNIPPTLVVNSNQIGVHIIPTTRERTWESKGSKHIQVLGVEDERKITMDKSLAAYSFLLPP